MLKPDDVRHLLANASESLSVEYKAWIIPTTPYGAGLIAKALLALRNYGGGTLVIGFTGEPLKLDAKDAPQDPRATYHADVITGILSKYASVPFDVSVEYFKVDEIDVPVIQVPSGVATPVVAKADLKDGERFLITRNRIYLRTLASNGTPSSSEIGYADWPQLMETCLDNREANIGRFLRRHLAAIDPAALQSGLHAILSATKKVSDRDSRLLLDSGRAAFDRAVAQRKLELPTLGTYEVAAVVRPALKKLPPTEDHLTMIRTRNPRHSGWPPWVALHGPDTAHHPYVMEDAWEALVWLTHDPGYRKSLDYWRIEPSGRLYLLRGLEDDLRNDQGRGPGSPTFDPRMAVMRLVEVLLVARAFARELAPPEGWSIEVSCRWRRIAGRELHVWSNPAAFFLGGQRARQDEVLSNTEYPGDASPESIASTVEALCGPLLAVFDGFKIAAHDYEAMTREVLGRRF